MPAIAPPPYRLNVRLTVAVLAVAIAQLFVAPLLLPHFGVPVAIAAIALSLATPLHRALMHEAIHSRLGGSRQLNDRLGRALAVTCGTAFDPVRFGHLTHHRFARHALDRPDVIEPGQSRLVAGAAYYAGLCGGAALRETLTSILLLLPKRVLLKAAELGIPKDDALRVLPAAIRRNLDRRLWRARSDTLVVIAVYAASFYLYGAWWPVPVAAVALRAFIISLQDNAAHYGTPAELNAPAHDTWLPGWARTFLLNNNLHGVHHARPDLPWDALPLASPPQERFGMGYGTLLLRQLRGPRRSFALNNNGAAGVD
ncbi:MAG: fatty acid desaturase [Pseudolabrys sp.]|nr:fatty acid desaturase [Pseudolabrys sp.]